MITKLYELNRLDEALKITDIKVVPVGGGKALSIKINGAEYRYVSDKITTSELHRKFTKMAGFSQGKALAWLKKNAIHFYGGTRFKKDVEMDKMKLESMDEAKDLAKNLAQALYSNRQKAAVKKLFSGKKLSLAEWIMIGDLAVEFASSMGETWTRAEAYDMIAECVKAEDLNESLDIEMQESIVHRAGTEEDIEKYELVEKPEWVVSTDTTINESETDFMYLPTTGLLFIVTENTLMSKEMTDEEAVRYVTGIFSEGIESLDIKNLLSEGFIF
ncbi:hypothetical protein SP15_269 [Bacillus phage SP-15]|uniref:Uncharacterized protein n=1 Tax=Bacillus phage SP-15 TaxID=1792032 RepID=A0A127AWI4_9CAUD|nr:hypothetical protein SP15_269 [Bacillus phage SP-15]AMM45076.1 hypothetical protein SP15_269 [Bacillus phage SP-15]